MDFHFGVSAPLSQKQAIWPSGTCPKVDTTSERWTRQGSIFCTPLWPSFTVKDTLVSWENTSRRIPMCSSHVEEYTTITSRYASQFWTSCNTKCWNVEGAFRIPNAMTKYWQKWSGITNAEISAAPANILLVSQVLQKLCRAYPIHAVIYSQYRIAIWFSRGTFWKSVLNQKDISALWRKRQGELHAHKTLDLYFDYFHCPHL